MSRFRVLLSMNNRLFLTFISTATVVAACSRAPSVDEQLKKDLEAASVGTMELAPSGQGTKVVSAIESKAPVQPRVAPVRRTTTPTPDPTPRPETRQVTQQSTEPTATVPRQLPASSVSQPRNPKSMGQIIRDAPFPINPATKKP
jgi:hypothetical protein